MKTYKIVPCANAIVVNKKESAQNAILKFYEVIQQECVDGWEFHSMSPVNVIRKLSKFKTEEESYYSFVFVKDEVDVIDEEPETEEAATETQAEEPAAEEAQAEEPVAEEAQAEEPAAEEAQAEEPAAEEAQAEEPAAEEAQAEEPRAEEAE